MLAWNFVRSVKVLKVIMTSQQVVISNGTEPRGRLKSSNPVST